MGERYSRTLFPTRAAPQVRGAVAGRVIVLLGLRCSRGWATGLELEPRTPGRRPCQRCFSPSVSGPRRLEHRRCAQVPPITGIGGSPESRRLVQERLGLCGQLLR